ncbi:arsenate reductase/protein-tyrosine-phosphatase family protein [Arthrobacter bambusae]|uniref:arsenate reductase/protein-tyrosine-phosphatase family protein n=1 Tax=Arthrobacter bambusae TaxID=1338426 RepID=UPI002789283E|nr:ArsR family transcriptional regulator [Arthrobacter bambusae]MDQ0028713.1 protein-tyrosine-phosphatase/DNA-binding transcriptional ArsR family regulator [Arthrobacter bambusae]MDQ0096493.1 protein-tyrosine-phosphatase/DNA-binding transcriptional ArsR family regulator [Arthrobacter bambusae]
MAGQPLLFLVAADPLRWALLQALSRSDRRVVELCAAVGRPQNLVSYHLRRLRDSGLVTSRRSSADGRDTYYALDLPRCSVLFADASAALHPGLAAVPPPDAPFREGRRPVSVLFLCTGNSSRSQVAEALFNQEAGALGRAVSAGSHPKPVHPETARVLAERGIDATGMRSKQLGEFSEGRFDYVVTLCDKVREVCPEFPGSPAPIHWSIPDPAAAGDGGAARKAFDDVAAELTTRISYLIKTIETTATEGAMP